MDGVSSDMKVSLACHVRCAADVASLSPPGLAWLKLTGQGYRSVSQCLLNGYRQLLELGARGLRSCGGHWILDHLCSWWLARKLLEYMAGHLRPFGAVVLTSPDPHIQCQVSGGRHRVAGTDTSSPHIEPSRSYIESHIDHQQYLVSEPCNNVTTTRDLQGPSIDTQHCHQKEACDNVASTDWPGPDMGHQACGHPRQQCHALGNHGLTRAALICWLLPGFHVSQLATSAKEIHINRNVNNSDKPGQGHKQDCPTDESPLAASCGQVRAISYVHEGGVVCDILNTPTVLSSAHRVYRLARDPVKQLVRSEAKSVDSRLLTSFVHKDHREISNGASGSSNAIHFAPHSSCTDTCEDLLYRAMSIAGVDDNDAICSVDFLTEFPTKLDAWLPGFPETVSRLVESASHGPPCSDPGTADCAMSLTCTGQALGVPQTDTSSTHTAQDDAVLEFILGPGCSYTPRKGPHLWNHSHNFWADPHDSFSPLPDSFSHYRDSFSHYHDSFSHYPGTFNKLSDGWSHLPDSWSNLSDGWSHLPDGWSHHPDGWNQLPDGWSHHTDGWNQLPDGWSHLDKDCSHLADGLSQLANGCSQHPDALNGGTDAAVDVCLLHEPHNPEPEPRNTTAGTREQNSLSGVIGASLQMVNQPYPAQSNYMGQAQTPVWCEKLLPLVRERCTFTQDAVEVKQVLELLPDTELWTQTPTVPQVDDSDAHGDRRQRESCAANGASRISMPDVTGPTPPGHIRHGEAGTGFLKADKTHRRLVSTGQHTAADTKQGLVRDDTSGSCRILTRATFCCTPTPGVPFSARSLCPVFEAPAKSLATRISQKWASSECPGMPEGGDCSGDTRGRQPSAALGARSSRKRTCPPELSKHELSTRCCSTKTDQTGNMEGKKASAFAGSKRYTSTSCTRTARESRLANIDSSQGGVTASSAGTRTDTARHRGEVLQGKQGVPGQGLSWETGQEKLDQGAAGQRQVWSTSTLDTDMDVGAVDGGVTESSREAGCEVSCLSRFLKAREATVASFTQQMTLCSPGLLQGRRSDQADKCRPRVKVCTQLPEQVRYFRNVQIRQVSSRKNRARVRTTQQTTRQPMADETDCNNHANYDTAQPISSRGSTGKRNTFTTESSVDGRQTSVQCRDGDGQLVLDGDRQDPQTMDTAKHRIELPSIRPGKAVSFPDSPVDPAGKSALGILGAHPQVSGSTLFSIILEQLRVSKDSASPERASPPCSQGHAPADTSQGRNFLPRLHPKCMRKDTCTGASKSRVKQELKELDRSFSNRNHLTTNVNNFRRCDHRVTCSRNSLSIRRTQQTPTITQTHLKRIHSHRQTCEPLGQEEHTMLDGSVHHTDGLGDKQQTQVQLQTASSYVKTTAEVGAIRQLLAQPGNAPAESVGGDDIMQSGANNQGQDDTSIQCMLPTDCAAVIANTRPVGSRIARSRPSQRKCPIPIPDKPLKPEVEQVVRRLTVRPVSTNCRLAMMIGNWEREYGQPLSFNQQPGQLLAVAPSCGGTSSLRRQSGGRHVASGSRVAYSPARGQRRRASQTPTVLARPWTSGSPAVSELANSRGRATDDDHFPETLQHQVSPH